MKMIKKGLALLIVAILFAGTASAQSSVAAVADQQFQNKQYILALESYQKAYDRVSSNKAEKNRIYFQMGECYRLMYNYPKAQHTYRRLIQAGYYTVEPKIYYYMAEMCRFSGEFDDADSYYDKFLEFLDRDLLFVDQRGDGIDVRTAEVAADDRCEGALVVLLVADHCIVLVGCADALVAHIPFLFERAHHCR